MHVKESVSELKKLLPTTKFTNRIKMLILIKEHEYMALSNRTLCKMLGKSLGRKSQAHIAQWSMLYETGGISNILKDKRKIRKLFSEEEHKKIEAKLNDPTSDIKTFNALLIWFNREFNKTISYKAFQRYCYTHFGSKFTVFHKLGVKNDENSRKKKQEARKGEGKKARRHEEEKVRKNAWRSRIEQHYYMAQVV